MVVAGGALGFELDSLIELLDGVLNRELDMLLVLSEEGLDGLDAGLIKKLLDSEELEEGSAVLNINSLLDSEMKLEDIVEL